MRKIRPLCSPEFKSILKDRGIEIVTLGDSPQEWLSGSDVQGLLDDLYSLVETLTTRVFYLENP